MTTRNLPPELSKPYIFTNGKLELTRTHVWTAEDGITHGTARLGGVEISFHDPAQVRDLIAYLAALAGEMDAEITRQRPAEVVELPEPAPVIHYSQTASRTACGLPTYEPPVHLGVLTVDPAKVTCPDCQPKKYWQDAAAGADALAIPANRIDPVPACWRCSATEAAAPLVEAPYGSEWQCSNRERCAERVAARDAEAAQCAKCHDEPRVTGERFGARCIDMCHEALEFDHCCVICATPEEAKALGFSQVAR